jgi:hypothetical protein
MIVFKTKNIDKEKYTDIIQRTIMLNGHDGTSNSGYKAWENFDQTWTLMILPVTEQEEYKRY